MALRKINPFTYCAFKKEVGKTALGIINHFMKKDTDFWLNTLHNYSFRGSDYLQGQTVRIEFNKELTSYTGNTQLFEIANRILGWGCLDPLSDSMRENLEASLNCLNTLAQDEDIDLNNLCVDRLASITKIYEMWDIDNWVIYDSYCARGLEWLIAVYWKQIGYRQNEYQLLLPWTPGEVGTQVPGFPIAATSNQKRLGFIYGSWLCKVIAEHLTAMDISKSFHWRPYHIEMLAFQLGHEINDKKRILNYAQ